MKQIPQICLACIIVTLLGVKQLQAHSSNTYFGLEASLRYFEDTIKESRTLLQKTHELIDTIETSSKQSSEYAICHLCGNYEKLLAHIDNLIEGSLHAVIPETTWIQAISEDLQRMLCLTWQVIQHLKQSEGYTGIENNGTYCIDDRPNTSEWTNPHSRTRQSLRLLEVSIEIFRFHIELTREAMSEQQA